MRTIFPIIVLCLCSCSFFNAPRSQSLALPEEMLEEGALGMAARQISDEPILYSISKGSGAGEQNLYAALLEECFDSERPQKLSASTRQLLVGFKELELRNQKNLELKENSVLVSIYSAKLDETALELISYSLLKDGCLYDLVLWEPKLAANGAGNLEIAELDGFDKFAQIVLTSLQE